MDLTMSGQMMQKFSLNQIQILNQKFTTADHFHCFKSIRRQSLDYEPFRGLFHFKIDKSKSFFINSIPIALSVIKYIEMQSLDNHLLNERDIEIFGIT